MIRIVESFFESNGDPGKLKFSLLEEYAVSVGMDVKAYDFKRNADVRGRMEELRGLAGVAGRAAIAYKSIDVDAFLNRNYTKEMLKTGILELDEAWRRVYERAAVLSKENAALLSALKARERDVEATSAEKKSCAELAASLKRDLAALAAENRYLRKSLKEYLYPAIANEILRRENVLEQSDTDVMPETMAALADNDVPTPLSASVARDRIAVSRAEAILKRMEDQIHGKSKTQETHH
jgi:hypothetical protein